MAESVERARAVITGEAKCLASTCSREVTSVCSEVLRTQLFRVELQGHERLFKHGFQLSNASSFFTKRPLLTAEDTLIHLVPSFDLSMLELMVGCTLGAIQQFLVNYSFVNTTEKPDASFLQKFFGCFMKQPHVSMREIYFRVVKDKPLGRGSIDVLAGTLNNGNKPVVKVGGIEHGIKDVFLWVVTEAKHPSEQLSANLPDSRVPLHQDIKAFYQPITTLCSLAELCKLTNDNVPVIGFFGSRYSYRPLLYFRKHDVLFTTETSFTYFDECGQIDMHGLAFLRVLIMLEKYPFDVKCLTSDGKKLGWMAARRERNPDVFRDVHLSVESDGVEGQNPNPNDMAPPIASLATSIRKRTYPTCLTGESTHSKQPRK